MDFFTYFTEYKGKLLLSGYDKGQKVTKTIKIEPYLFKPDPQGTYKTIKGEPVSMINFDTTSEARGYLKKYEDVANFNIYGSTYFDYVAINDLFEEIKGDVSRIKIGNIDIETDSEGGYADVETADKMITSFQIKRVGSKKAVVLGLKEWDPTIDEDLKKESPGYEVIYIKCSSEREMMIKFIELWRWYDFDILTGYNIEAYDVPYIIRRMIRVLSEDHVKKLSPFGIIKSRKIVNNFGKEQEIFEIVGVPALDYFLLYKKFTFKNHESFKLDYVAHAELGKKKLDYSEYKTLNNLYHQNPAKFYAYGVIDIIRVDELEDKLKLIDLAVALAHFTKTNLLDGFATVKPVDVYIHNTLIKQGKVIPLQKRGEELHRKIAGGYVKEPQIGHHPAVMSFDFTSLYPFVIQCFNVSPDTYIGKLDQHDHLGNMMDIINGAYAQHNKHLMKQNVCLTGKGTVFDRSYKGFLTEMMEEGFALRKKYKEEMLKYKKQDPNHPKVTEFNNKQLATKIFLNSCYGMLANQHSRWFSYDIAETITMTGQLCTKTVEKFINEYMRKRTGLIEKDFIIAVDTDSCYVDVSDLVDDSTTEEDYIEISHQLEAVIEGACAFIYQQCNAYQEKLHMKLECIGQALWRGAKNYVMTIWHEEGVFYRDKPKIKMQGIEAVKSSTPEICRDQIKKCIPLIVNKEQKKLVDEIENFRESFYSQPFEKVAFPRGVSDVEGYKNATNRIPYHVKASLVYNNLLEKKQLQDIYLPILNGDKIRICYLRVPNPVNSKVIASPDELPEEFDLDFYIDYQTQFEKAFLKPIKSLADVAGMDISGKQDLDAFYQ